uniref:Ubiquitin carboxyl-terminal hydrolase n=1 Tax=Albugo laibachii Nc14 TaxID=890382 RepID=F0WMR3_9STRA|nr:ubiquitin carboxylterminal hydrolase putative [Albugo laibachii Nc14]|eukprot:CCA22598.1 ubiquitin carboxylterminal hydrolase putative [Albugo laibachii Nc14]
MSWCTIESDPGVFTALLKDIGVKGAQMEELYSLDREQFQSMGPVYGLIFLFKWEKSQHTVPPETTCTPKGSTPPPENLFFAKQVISNACATQAILSIVLNAAELDIGDTLREFKSFTRDFPPDLKGLAISNSELIRQAHNSFARPDPFVMEERKHENDDDEVYHFIAYVPVNGKVYELDGLQEEPISIGNIPATSNSNNTAWLDIACPKIQARIEKYATSEIRFNLLALIRNRSDVYQHEVEKLQVQTRSPESLSAIAQYQDMICQEGYKQKQWVLENARRKHNYIPFVVQLLKILAEKNQLEPLIQQQLEPNTNIQ